MTEPMITCPNCKTEIKLTESLAAPLIELTRREFEQRLAQKDTDIEERIRQERAKIAAEEARKAKLAVATDLEQKAREVTDLEEVLKQRDTKLAEAQKAQAELVRKQRELDDIKRELELTVEMRVQEGLAVTRDQARKEAEEQLKFKVVEKEQTIASMQKQIENLKQKDAEVTKRESSLREREEDFLKEKETLEEQVSDKMHQERAKIAAEEAKKAKLALATDLGQKDREIADLQEVLKSRDEKLADAQKAQAELLRKQPIGLYRQAGGTRSQPARQPDSL